MKAVFFAAGLGDFIKMCYQTTSYCLLDTVDEMTAVILALHNPYGCECFMHHPNRHRFRVIDLPGQFDLLKSSGMSGKELHHGLIRAAGINPEQVILERRPSQPTFYALDDIAVSDAIVIQPFAGGTDRTMPMSILARIVAACQGLNREVHIISRGFRRTYGPWRDDEEENLPSIVARNSSVTWHQNLSVPATINLVKRSALFIGTHSSMLMAAWFEKRNVHVLYPRNHVDWTADRRGRGYAFGANYETTIAQSFEEFQISKLESQLRTLQVHDSAAWTNRVSGKPGNRFLRRRQNI